MEKLVSALLILSNSLTGALRTSSYYYSHNCGRANVPMRLNIRPPENGQRIVGGIEARPGSHPWMVSLKIWGQHWCGGAIIRVTAADESDIVITAAHCVYDKTTGGLKPIYAMTITAGAHDISHNGVQRPGQQTVQVMNAFIHDGYKHAYNWNDIAVIKVSTPIRFNDNVQPICLPIGYPVVKDGAELIVAGWGYTQDGVHVTSDLLMQVGLNAIDHTYCSRKYGSRDMVTLVHDSMMLCAGRLEGGHDSCQGDSGGPLIEKYGDVYIARGLVSFGGKCGAARVPGVYARVSNYLPWIQGKVELYSNVARRPISLQLPLKSQSYRDDFTKKQEDLIHTRPMVSSQQKLKPAFGSGRPTPIFGSGQPTPIFGSGRPTPIFGSGQPTPIFGSGRPTPIFGSGQSTPSFGSGQPKPLFGSGRLKPLFGSGKQKPLLPISASDRPNPIFGSGHQKPTLTDEQKKLFLGIFAKR